MQRRQFVWQVVAWGFTGAAACGLPGCGTLIHGERRGRPHSDQLDWSIVLLDGLGLLCFFIPGVVAFVVDFSTGAIYLPAEPSFPVYQIEPQQPPATIPPPPQQSAIFSPAMTSSVAQNDSRWQHLGLKRILVPRDQLRQDRIEQTVTHYVGRQVSLDDSQARVSRLPNLERFGEQANRHRSDRNFGVAVRSFFERLKPKTA